MKQLEIEVNGARYLFVELKAEQSYWMLNGFIHIGDICGEAYSLPKGNYSIIGFADDEEVCKQVVEHRLFGILIGTRNYLTNDFNVVNATESMASLLKANGVYTENPYRKPDRDDAFNHCVSGRVWELMNKQYDDAQSQIWQKILILKID